jgi:hypothetical protein
VALAHLGIVLGLGVSRLAKNNADRYRLVELCGVTDTLIGNSDGVYAFKKQSGTKSREYGRESFPLVRR